jgi:hypothetical protein
VACDERHVDSFAKQVAKPPRCEPGCRRSRGCERHSVHGRPRRDDHQRRTAADARGASHVDRRPAVGGQRLRAHVRRVPDAGRSGGRSVRAQAGVPARARRIHLVQFPGRACAELRGADRGPRRPGHWRCGTCSRVAEPAHRQVHRAARTPPGAGRVVGDRGERRPGRADRGRTAHRPHRLALGSVRERSRRDRGVRRRPSLARGVDWSAGTRRARCRRSPDRYGGDGRTHLRDRRDRFAPLGIAPDAIDDWGGASKSGITRRCRPGLPFYRSAS